MRIDHDFFVPPPRHYAQVTAINCLGAVTSNAVEVFVVETLDKLEIDVLNDDGAVLNQSLYLRAGHYKGSHANYTWDFGDGSQPITINNTPNVDHSYKR